MLADDFLQSLKSDPYLRQISSQKTIDPLRQNLVRASRYVLTQSALEVIIAIAKEGLASVVKAFPLIKTVEPIWIEYAYGDEGAARTVIGARPSDVPGMQRIGYLVIPRAPDGNELSIYQVQKNRNVPAGGGLQQVYLNARLDRPWSLAELPRHELARPFGGDAMAIMKGSYWGPEGTWKTADTKAAQEIVAHTYAEALPGYLDMIKMALRDRRHDTETFSMDMVAKLPFSSIIPFATMMALLKTRNRVVFEKSDLSRLNKQRAKTKAEPLLDYSTVKVSLTRDRAVYHGYRATGEGHTVESRRACLVNAHYKVRKTGIFLWHEHPRRGIGEPKPKTFVVVE